MEGKMVIETTINISDKNKNILNNYAQKLNINVNTLIIKLLGYYLNNQAGKYTTFKRLKYQKKEEGTIWRTLHIWLSSDFYEKCLDLRKFHKFSLSNILSQAINLYLEKISNSQYDNYPKGYLFIHSKHNNSYTFSLAWEIPEINKLTQIYELQEDT